MVSIQDSRLEPTARFCVLPHPFAYVYIRYPFIRESAVLPIDTYACDLKSDRDDHIVSWKERVSPLLRVLVVPCTRCFPCCA